MKKSITLTVLSLMLSLQMSADTPTRKTWNFTEGFSDITMNYLKADAANAKGLWTAKKNSYESKGRKAGPLYVVVAGNNTEISETRGLTFDATSSAHINIVYGAAGNNYVWINGSKAQDAVTIPKIEPNTKIVIDYETHKAGVARGFKCITSGFASAKDGTTKVFNTTGRDTAVIINKSGTVSDLKIQATSGFHIYSIVVGNGDDPNAFKTHIGYLYSGSTSNDPLNTLLDNEQNKLTKINVSADVSQLTADSLQHFDIMVLASSIPANSAVVPIIKAALPYVPTLNTNAGLYQAWGYGKAAGKEELAIVRQPSKLLFNNVEITNDEEKNSPVVALVADEQQATLVYPGSYFAGDDTLAIGYNDPKAVAIHQHNINHNGYIYLPFNAGTIYEGSQVLASNAITLLKASKTAITATATPGINVHYGNYKATVTLTSPEPYSQIHYTLNGQTPTLESPLYTGPIELSAATTVKAIAQGQGYLVSTVADSLVQMHPQAARPTIAIAQADDAATITLKCANEEADLWYNFSGSTDIRQSTPYTGPIVLHDHAILTAFATTADHSLVTSEPLTQEIFIQNDRVFIDQLSHFDADGATWTDAGKNPTYYFSWGKTAVDATDNTAAPIGTTTDADGIEIPIYPQRAVESYPTDAATRQLDWVLRSQGQVLLWQNTVPGRNVGDNSGYNPATNDDLDTLATKHNLQFGGTVANGYNARIESMKAFQGPFDVISFLGTTTGNLHNMVIESSVDGSTWTVVGDTMRLKVAKRLYKKFTVGYRGTDAVYLRLRQTGGTAGCQVYDLYVLNEGPKSRAMEETLKKAAAAGIGHKTETANKAPHVVAIYTIGGLRVGHPQHGINILRLSDGTARKVVIR